MLNFFCPLVGIGSLFDKIGCDRGVLSDLLGSSEEVKDDNMMQYLGLIEQKANELLAAQCYLDSEVNLREMTSPVFVDFSFCCCGFVQECFKKTN